MPGFGTWAKADLGVESKCPLSDPHQAKIDERTVGTWRAVIQEKTYFLHVGIGNVVGQSNWMELVLVNPGEKPTFYLHHKNRLSQHRWWQELLQYRQSVRTHIPTTWFYDGGSNVLRGKMGHLQSTR